MRVAQFLTEQQITFESIVHPPAYSAQKRAKYLHIPGKLVAKAILLSGPSNRYLAVLPATHQIDTHALRQALGQPVRLADAREIEAVFRDCELGVVSPFGSLYGLSTLLEATLDPESLLVFEGHTHMEGLRLRCRDFERLERPRRLPFARPVE